MTTDTAPFQAETPSRPTPRLARASSLLSVTAAALVAGCGSSLGTVDRDVDALLADRAAILDGGTIAPDREFPEPTGNLSPAAVDRSPATVNPPSDALEFNPADPQREVAELLARYNAESLADPDEPALELTLPETFRTANNTGRELLSAEETYILTAIRYLIEKHRWSPRLFNDTSVGLSGSGDDGTFDHTLDLINTLRVAQRLPFGGDVEARWVVNATDQLRDEVSNSYRQSSRIVLAGNVPLLRGFGTVVAQENLIQAERDVVYAARNFERFRRQYLVQIANDYFNLLETLNRIDNQQRQIESLELFNRQTRAQVSAGRLRPFQVQIVESDLLSARADLESLRNQFVLQLERFKVRLGIPVETRVRVLPIDFDIPEPSSPPDEAAVAALRYRLDLQNERDQLEDIRRAVAIARDNTRADLDLSASVTIPTDPDDNTGGLGFDDDETDYRLGATYSWPLDRRIERLSLREATIRLERELRDFERFRDNIVIEARQAVRSVELARFQLRLAEQRVTINELALTDLGLRQDADPQDVIDAQNRLLNAENSRDQAVTRLRTAVLDYLLTTGQLRLTDEGFFQTLPGMNTGIDDDPDQRLPAEVPAQAATPAGA